MIPAGSFGHWPPPALGMSANPHSEPPLIRAVQTSLATSALELRGGAMPGALAKIKQPEYPEASLPFGSGALKGSGHHLCQTTLFKHWIVKVMM